MPSDHPYPSFPAFVEGVVLPRLLEHPGRVRLDGWETREKVEGNWAEAGRFLHDGDTWKVHEDSRFEPILLAYLILKYHPERPALVRADTGKNVRLDLVPELQALYGSRDRHLYLYLVE